MHTVRLAPRMVIGILLLISLDYSCAATSGQSGASIPAIHAYFDVRGGSAMSFEFNSPAFRNGDSIPGKYTCDGADVSPALRWSGVPVGTHSLALITEDPDAPGGTWTHWIIWNIPAQATSLPEGLPATGTLENGARQGRNGFGRIGYGGPCPPPGRPHRYFFHLYALDTTLALKPDASKEDLEIAMKGHVLSRVEWMGKYGR